MKISERKSQIWHHQRQAYIPPPEQYFCPNVCKNILYALIRIIFLTIGPFICLYSTFNYVCRMIKMLMTTREYGPTRKKLQKMISKCQDNAVCVICKDIKPHFSHTLPSAMPCRCPFLRTTISSIPIQETIIIIKRYTDSDMACFVRPSFFVASLFNICNLVIKLYCT